jgi:hypothetical protein
MPAGASLSPGNEHLIGDLVLSANAFINTSKFQELTAPPTDLEIAAEVMPTWEPTNPRDLAYGMARVYRMIEFLGGDDLTVKKLTAQLGLAVADLRFDNLPIQDFIAIVFGLHAHLKQVPPGILLGNPKAAAFSRGRFLSETNFPQDVFDEFLAKRSLQISQMQDKLTGASPMDADGFAAKMADPMFPTDFLGMREHPLIDVGNDDHIVLDVQFLAELLFRGLFFGLLSSLPSDKREDFSSLWGRILELSLIELFEHYYPIAAGILEVDVSFDRGKIDALLDFGEAIVVFEFKHFTLIHASKYSHDAAALERALRLKLVENQEGKPKAVRQLAQSTSAIRDGRVPTLRGDASKNPRTAALYPVIVVADDGLEALGVNAFLNEVFQTYTRGLDIKPLTVMSVQELEDVLPCTQAGLFSWPDLLEARFDGSRVKLLSVHQARYDLLKAKGAPYVRNEFRLDQFSAIYSHILDRYKGTDS